MSRSTVNRTNPTTSRYLDETEAAAICHVTVRTVQQWRWRKLGPQYIKIGSGAKGKGRILYDLDDIIAWLAAHKIRTESL